MNLLGIVIIKLIEDLLAFVFKLIGKEYTDYETRKANEAKNKQNVLISEKATSVEELRAANEKLLNNK
jgi:hypothetical protein